jgi:hypothetical protein
VVEIEPVGNRILVKPLDPEEWPDDLGKKPETSIALPDNVKLGEDLPFEFGIILGVGTAVKSLGRNDYIIYGASALRPVISNRIFLQESEVWGTYSE